MRIKLPRGRVLEGQLLAGFDHERERLDGIMARKPARVASSAPAGIGNAQAAREFCRN